MNVRQVMTVDVVAVDPQRSIRDVAALFAARRINGAPVIDRGELTGIVTSTDLMRAAEDGRSCSVGDVMSRDVVTLTEGMTVAEATRVLARDGLHRAPVLRGTKVVGMVTRTDLLRPYLRTDGEIHADVEETLSRSMGITHRELHARVLDGVVFLEGTVSSGRDHGLLLRLVSRSTGVVDVIDHVRVAPAPGAPSPNGEG